MLQIPVIFYFCGAFSFCSSSHRSPVELHGFQGHLTCPKSFISSQSTCAEPQHPSGFLMCFMPRKPQRTPAAIMESVFLQPCTAEVQSSSWIVPMPGVEDAFLLTLALYLCLQQCNKIFISILCYFWGLALKTAYLFDQTDFGVPIYECIFESDSCFMSGWDEKYTNFPDTPVPNEKKFGRIGLRKVSCCSEEVLVLSG